MHIIIIHKLQKIFENILELLIFLILPNAPENQIQDF